MDRFPEKLIDGQIILFPPPSFWDSQEPEGMMPGAQVKRVRDEIGFIAEYPYFCMGMTQVPGNPPWWNTVVFYVENEHYQRVFLELLQCLSCGWEGVSANPMMIDIYLGVEDHFKLMKRAEATFPKLNCPTCDSLLPRYSIWVEPQ